MMRYIQLTCALMAMLCVAGPLIAADFAAVRWDLGSGGQGAPYPLTAVGRIETGVASTDPAAADRKVARLTDAYFDAGRAIRVVGEQVTVYLRARDPRGQWSYALFNKRGSHDVVNFNLFSVDLPDTPGPDIGFELHSERGFVLVSFPVSRINATAWHDFIGRYDGRSIELLCDGMVMARKLWRGGALTQNDEPVLIGAETDNGQVVRRFTGEMATAALWARALSDKEMAKLMGKDSIKPGPGYVEPYTSPLHYRPTAGALADTIPFFWKGEYHIFYLRANIGKVPWEHIVSTDLIHWRELPTALVADGDPNGPDGENMFTGSVIEKDGGFHIFYTGHNPRNPQGFEQVMHATSADLIHWTKHAEHAVRADGVTYRNSDFRDPYVLWNEAAHAYWMILCARDAKTGHPVQGVAESTDLVAWRQIAPLPYDPPLGEGTAECPDLFRIGARWYLIHSPSAGTTDVRYADAVGGTYHRPEPFVIDTPLLYAAKRMFDGKRHVLTGWIRDLGGETDGGDFRWGGDQCVPREVYPGPRGQLYFRPVPEAVALFTRTVLDTATDLGQAAGQPAQRAWNVPDNYMLSCRVKMDPAATFTLALRRGDDPAAGYRLILRPAAGEASIESPRFHYPRKIDLDATRPNTLRVFVQGPIIECFVNDAYAFTCRAYDYRSGKLGLAVQGGQARVESLTVKTMAR